MKKTSKAFLVSLFAIAVGYGVFFAFLCGAKPNGHDGIDMEATTPNENGGGMEPLLQEDPSDRTSYAAYVSRLTSFYEQIITILFGVIGIILVISFLYLGLTSKTQAREMATEALDARSFQIVLDREIDDRFVESKNKGDINDLFVMLEELDAAKEELEKKQTELKERITFIESVITEKSYEDTLRDSSDETQDGNN